MPIWLAPIIAWLSHNIARFVGVVVIGSILIGAPMLAYHHLKSSAYNEGYKKGYSQALTDHPQNIGTMIIGDDTKFFVLKIWKLKLSA